MYFSVLPLLILLFTSAICASPVNVEHHASTIPINNQITWQRVGIKELAPEEKDNDIYKKWDELLKEGWSWDWSEIYQAYEMQGEHLIPGMIGKVPCTLMGAGMEKDANVAPIMNKINYLRTAGELLGWGWGIDTDGKLRIIFAKVPEGKVKAKWRWPRIPPVHKLLGAWGRT